MSDRNDVAARLSEGQPAVEHLQTYVQACHAIGYQNPDLTAHASQVGRWYDTESGLDLRTLGGDVVELRAAVTAIDEALWLQRTQLTDLKAAWRGSGAESAARFLQRHCDAAEEVAMHVRGAAEQCAALRDDLWQAVDDKVATTVAIDERSAAQRSTWLAASHTVRSAESDRSAAELVVHQQIMPFVDNDIRNDWLATMSTANARVAASYDETIHALASTRDTRFDIPGDLGPWWQPWDGPGAVTVPMTPVTASPLPTVPASLPTPEAPQALAVEDRGGPPQQSAAPFGDTAGLSTGTSGFGGMPGGIGGVVDGIVDSIGSLLSSLAGESGSGLESDPIDLDSARDPLLGDADRPHDAPDDVDPASLDDDSAPEAPVIESPPIPAEVAAEPVGQSVDAAPLAAPPVDRPVPVAAPPADGSTPCEIAEDQLPQAGQ